MSSNPIFLDNYAGLVQDTRASKAICCIYPNPWGSSIYSIGCYSNKKAFACIASTLITAAAIPAVPIPVPPGAPEWFNPEFEEDDDK